MYLKAVIKNIQFLIIALVLSISAYAQRNVAWADNILKSLKEDQRKDFILTENYIDTILNVYSVNNKDCNWIKSQLFKSYFLIHKQYYKEALRGIFLANQKLTKSNCKGENLLADIYLAYSFLYNRLNEIKKAQHYAKKGIESWNPQWTNKDILVLLYINVSNTFNVLDSQLYYGKIAYKYALESKSIKMQESALSAVGAAYAVAEKSKQANRYLKQALNLAHQRKGYSSLSSLYNNLAGLTDDVSLISNYLDSALYFAKLSEDLEDIQTCTQNRAYFYYLTQNYKKGYNELWKSMVLSDSIFNKAKIKAFAEMEQKFESEKKATEIELLKKENQIAILAATSRLIISYSMGAAIVAIGFVAFGFYKQTQKRKKLNTELTIEKQKSDYLLLNILPEEVAEELKEKGFTEAKLYNHVTVLFTDFVNFTGISEKLSPKELVEEIHKNFTAFDLIMEEYGLEKIKTIGDAYLAVCGLPDENANHAQNVLNAAKEIVNYMHNSNALFKIRIGVNSGPVVAGIVGVKKYAYDIWGDTVNTAARLEQHSEAGMINISGSTFELTKNDFTFSHRGKIQVKNKGEIDMYFVA